MPTSYLDLEGLEYLWGKAGETFSPKNIDASSIAANGVEGKIVSDNNPLVIKDVAYPQNTKDIVVDLSPVQDFNGYDKPWVGGAGKNLVDQDSITAFRSTISKSNDVITVTVTNALYAGANANTVAFKSGVTYAISCHIKAITKDPNWAPRLTIRQSSDNKIIANAILADSKIEDDLSATYKPTADIEAYVSLLITGNTEASAQVEASKIQLEANSSATSFEPYSNICPIYPANGRNLLNPDLFFPNTSYGMTLTCDANTGRCSFSGTNNQPNAMNVFVTKPQLSNAIFLKAGITYYFCGNWEDGHTPSANTPRLDLRKYDGSSEIYAYETNVSGGQYTPAEDVYVRICTRFPTGYTSEGLGFKPVLTTDSNTSFIPYQSINVKREGKNLLPMTVDGIKALNTSGSWSGNEYTWNGITYTIMTDSSNNVIGIRGNGTASARGWIFLAEKDFGQTRAIFTSSGVLENNYYFSSGNTLDDGTKQFIYYNNGSSRTYLLIDNGHVVNDQIWYPMIRLATEADATFEPYQPTSITLSLGQDVYGGTYDIGKGELTIDRAIVIIDGSRTTITSGSTTTNQYGYTWLYSLIGQTNIKDFLNKSLTNKYVFVNKTHNNLSPYEYTCSLDRTGTNITMRFVCNDPSVTNKTTLLEWLANNPVELVYPLETPITIHLSSLPQSDQLSLLQGYNVISSSDGISGFEVSYDAIQESTVQAEIDELGEISRVQAANSKATDDAIDDLRDDTAIVISSVSSESKIASFNDGVEGFPVRDLEIEFEPVQDLHGYNKPWVGGAGKNLLPFPYFDGSSKTSYGITYTVNADSSVVANGTATETSTFQFTDYSATALDFLQTGQYIITGCPDGGDASKYEIQIRTNNNWVDETGEGRTINYVNGSSTENYSNVLRIRIVKGTTVNNIVFKPMVRLATNTDDTFEPYENICPIYPANGRNLLENTATTQIINEVTFSVNSDDTITANGTATSNAQLVIGTVSLKGNTAYVINGCPSGGGSSTYRLYFEGVSAGSTYDNGSGATYTPTEDENRNIKMVVYSGATVSNLVFKPMICLASANPTFIPYQAIEVKRTGKNLIVYPWTPTIFARGITFSANTDGSVTATGTNDGTDKSEYYISRRDGLTGNHIYLNAGTYILSAEGLNGFEECAVGHTSNGAFEGLTHVTSSEKESMFTLSKKESIQLFIVVNKSATVNNTIYPMIRLASVEDNTYEPYTSTTLTLPLDRDVYGGRYNVVSGELTIDREYISITPDMIDAINTTNFGGVVVGFTSSGSYTNRSVLLCDSMTAIEFTVANFSKTDRIGVRQEDGRLVLTPNWVQSATTLEQFKSLLSDNPVNIIASLATPLTYQLPPQQLTTLSKSNVIMTDSGYISNCEYYADAKTYVDERFVYVITNSQIDDIFDTLD